MARVSTNQDELVLTTLMCPYLARSDCAFDVIIKDPDSFDQKNLSLLQAVLICHPKSAARKVAASKVKGRQAMSGFNYEQRICLPKKVKH
eukprot:7229302-Ditylum_brightwellii.AAC.1